MYTTKQPSKRTRICNNQNISQKHKKMWIAPKLVHIAWRTFIVSKQFFTEPRNLGENRM